MKISKKRFQTFVMGLPIVRYAKNSKKVSYFLYPMDKEYFLLITDLNDVSISRQSISRDEAIKFFYNEGTYYEVE